MHFVEQRRHALYLIEHHDAPRGQIAHFHGQQSGIGEQRLVAGLVQKVYEVRIRKLLSRPGAFPDAANSKEEEASFGRRGQTGIPGVATMPLFCYAFYRRPCTRADEAHHASTCLDKAP